MVLFELAKQLQKLEGEILSSRIIWDGKTKPFVLDHLNKVKTDTGLNVDITVDRCIINQESIVFSFVDSFCGLSYDPCNEQNIALGFHGNILQKGASLQFNQRYNGQVIIWMEYPCLQFMDRTQDRKTEIFTSLSQHNLDAQMIDKSLQDFLSKVTTWHRREYKPSLGNSYK